MRGIPFLLAGAALALVLPCMAHAAQSKTEGTLTNAQIDARKHDLSLELAQWTAFIQKDYNEQIAHLKSQEAARLAFEKKATIEWGKFYVSLEAMKLADRDKAFLGFKKKMQEERSRFNSEEGKREAKFAAAEQYENRISTAKINHEMNERLEPSGNAAAKKQE
ncbi:MAG TPA: hypothetical protein VNH15_08550 [Elusimicrobiota bacterium]|nr:hypothetical protein [Elusimicrobiota bacterium]